MLRFSLFAILLMLLNGCESSTKNKLPRIAIAGLAIESSTFSPAQTTIEAFHARRAEEVFSYYPFLNEDQPLRQKAIWFPTLRGHALPGGIVTREAYESLVEETLSRLRENLPYDGLFFDIHGAMSVVGLEDPEADFIERIREVVGYKTLISTSMDLHGNVSKRLAQGSDLITCYRMAPHEDALESKERALRLLVNRLENGLGKPAYKAYVRVPILLPGEKTSTRIDPGKSLYAQVAPLAAQKGVLDAAIWIGYAWADEARNHAVVMVTGDDQNKVREAAETLANAFWNVRRDFDFVAPTTTFDKALAQALNSNQKPFVISDMGDNPTAGGAGDVTWTLRELLNRNEFKSPDGPSVIYASIPGPNLVAKALEVGIGNTVEATVGAAVDNRYAPPLKLKGTVKAIHQGDSNAEVEVVVQTGSLQVIVTQKRKPYHYEKDFTTLNLNPREVAILIVKIGYLVPELYNLRGDWVMALTPGGVDQDLERLPYQNVIRPLFPLDPDMPDPNLEVDWIPQSGSTLQK
jgi:microcystin degradation protein MlrC